MKKTDRSLKGMLSFGAAALLAVGAATAQVATEPSFPGSAGIDASGNYGHEVQACNSGATQQDRATCLREARNASADKKRGKLETYGGHDSHATARCEVHKVAEDKEACRARVMGSGSVDGSVAGGGLIRELETEVPTSTMGNN